MNKSVRNIRAVLAGAALATFSIGVATLTMPNLLVGWFDGSQSEDYHFVRFIGTALIGFAVMNFVYSKSPDIASATPALWGNLVSLLLAVIVDAVSVYSGELNALAILLLVLHAIFAALFSYCIYLTGSLAKDWN